MSAKATNRAAPAAPQQGNAEPRVALVVMLQRCQGSGLARLVVVHSSLVAAARMARSAPAFPLSDAFEAAGAHPPIARRFLEGLPTRGRCNESVSQVLDLYLAGFDVLTHPACPPGLSRTRSTTYRGVSDNAGTTGWAERSAMGASMTRRKAARFADSDDKINRGLAAGHGWQRPDPTELGAMTEPQVAACPPLMLHRLAADPSSFVRGSTAFNPACGAHTLRMLAADDNDTTRRWALANPACPPHLLRHHRDASSDLREHLAASRHTRVATLRMLAEDPHEGVRSVAAANLRLRTAPAQPPDPN